MTNFEKLEQVIQKWLLIEDKGLIKVMAGIVIANKLQADPVWLFIVAAPGGTKTELIRGLNKIPEIYPISDLTPNTFLSGEKGANGSLLLRLKDGTILTYKDFTTVLTMHRDKRHAILSQLREIYDGYYRKEFGTGETKTWEGKMGFIAGVTSVIDNHSSVFQVLGERFIQYRPIQPDTIALAKRAMANSGGEGNMREEIQDAFAEFVNNLPIPEEKMSVSEELTDRLAHLAAFCVKARSGVIRDSYSSREIELIPDTELPTRLAKQFVTMYLAFNLIGNTDREEDYELVYKIAMDTLPQKRRMVIESLMKTDLLRETTEIASAISYPANTIRRILEDLHGLGLLRREKFANGFSDKWTLSDYCKMLLAKAKPPRLQIETAKVEADPLPEASGDQQTQMQLPS